MLLSRRRRYDHPSRLYSDPLRQVPWPDLHLWPLPLYPDQERFGSPMTRTAQILAEMRSDNTATIKAFNESIDEVVEAKGRRMRRNGVVRTGGSRYALATSKGRSDANLTSTILLKGTETFDRNAAKREHQLPARALSMASSRGRVRPDMLESLMAFFSSPGDMAHHLLLSFLPVRVASTQAKDLLADPFVVDVIEGLGVKVPTNMANLVRSINPANTHAGRAPSRLLIASPGVAPTVDAKRRGRPSGPKYVSFLPFGQEPIQGCEDISGIPGGNDVAQGPGHDQGAGWAKAWAEGKALSPAQVARRDAAIDEVHSAAAAQVASE